MPAGKNCPNCGAPYDLNLDKCPYCDTLYFDLSAIDFTDDKPLFLKVKTVMSGRPATMTMKVAPELGGMKLSCNRDSCYDPYGHRSYTIQRDVDMSMAISFRVVPTSDGCLCAIRVEQ